MTTTPQNNKGQKKSKLWIYSKQAIYAYIVIIVALVAFGVGTRFNNSSTPATNELSDVSFEPFWEIWKTVNSTYVDRPLDHRALLYGAIKGMVNATEDPYSQFLTPEETALFTSQIEGKFEGIGAEIGLRDDIITAITPLPGSPAEQAGLRPLDKIVKVDNTETIGMSVDEAVQLIRGPKGSIVTLTIVREENEDQQEQELKITRDTISIKSVELTMLENNIAHIELRNFGTDTVKEFNAAADELTKNHARGVILDVRNDPGGLLDVAINISSLFLHKGDVVLIEDKGNGEREEHKAVSNNKLNEIPVVVLINEGSASASEILAGALRDNKGTPLIGKTSFGKGSVQDYEQVDVGEEKSASLRVTVAKWLTPKGISINENGLEPDEDVEINSEHPEQDTQLEKAIEFLLKQ